MCFSDGSLESRRGKSVDKTKDCATEKEGKKLLSPLPKNPLRTNKCRKNKYMPTAPRL